MEQPRHRLLVWVMSPWLLFKTALAASDLVSDVATASALANVALSTATLHATNNLGCSLFCHCSFLHVWANKKAARSD